MVSLLGEFGDVTQRVRVGVAEVCWVVSAHVSKSTAQCPSPSTVR